MSPTAADLEHAPNCSGAELVERETPRHRLLVCRTCGAQLYLPRVSRWRQ